MKFCFSVYDMNGDGFIGRCEDAYPTQLFNKLDKQSSLPSQVKYLLSVMLVLLLRCKCCWVLCTTCIVTVPERYLHEWNYSQRGDGDLAQGQLEDRTEQQLHRGLGGAGGRTQG